MKADPENSWLQDEEPGINNCRGEGTSAVDVRLTLEKTRDMKSKEKSGIKDRKDDLGKPLNAALGVLKLVLNCRLTW